MDMQTIMKVKNRSAGMVVYRIPEHGIRREFAAGEVKKVPYEELVWLSYVPGGRQLMELYLQIQNAEAIEDLNIHTEPEYYMTETQIVDLLQDTSKYDEFLDALDFAPAGVIDLIKALSVNLPLTDTRKIEAIRNKTGFDVAAAIENSKADEEVEAEAPATNGRRVQKTAEASAPARRTESKYEIVE